MRTYRNLWTDFCSLENLQRAYRRCRRRKRYKAGALEFDWDREGQLCRLLEELNDGTYTPGPYRHFFVQEPKPRRISAAPFRDRVVHHALVQVIQPIFERGFIDDSYACRVEKGVHRALRRAQYYLRRHRFVLQTDVVRFFPSIDHAVLSEKIERRIRDQRLLIVIRRIIDSGRGVHPPGEADSPYFPGDDLFAALRPRGLPIGNLTSQFFANLFLDRIDHYIKEELRVPGYVRYADDLTLFGNDKQRLWSTLERLREQFNLERLRLHPQKTTIHAASRGIVYLGARITGDSRRLSQAAIRRFNRRLRRQKRLFADGRMSAEEVKRSLIAWRGYVGHFNTHGIGNAIASRVRFQRKTPKTCSFSTSSTDSS